MKFVTLHGAIGNPEGFIAQTQPIVDALKQRGSPVEFYYPQGFRETHPPADFQLYFGPGPHYRWLDDSGLAENAMLQRIRDLPDDPSPEGTMRLLGGEKETRTGRAFSNLRGSLDALHKMLEEIYPDAVGLMGYSEGSLVAATLILDEQRMFEKSGRPRRIKYAIFFTGWPALDENGDTILSDERDDMVDIPTLHVVGGSDPYLKGALALYNICDEDCSQMFDTGGGHVIPRDKKVVGELAEAIDKLVTVAR